MDSIIADSIPKLSAIEVPARGDLFARQIATAIMARGDVHVLDRLEKADRRADRAARRLMRKLARTKRNRKAASHPTVTSPFFDATSFASATNLIANGDVLVAKRRLAKARDTGGHRAFYVDELCGGLDPEQPCGLVVMPRSQDADPDLVGKCITQDCHTRTKTSTDFVTILHAADRTTIQSAGVTGNQVAVCKVHVDNGMTLFYAHLLQSTDVAPLHANPWRLGLDRETTTCIQTIVARLLGAKLE